MVIYTDCGGLTRALQRVRAHIQAATNLQSRDKQQHLLLLQTNVMAATHGQVLGTRRWRHMYVSVAQQDVSRVRDVARWLIGCFVSVSLTWTLSKRVTSVDRVNTMRCQDRKWTHVLVKSTLLSRARSKKINRLKWKLHDRARWHVFNMMSRTAHPRPCDDRIQLFRHRTLVV